MECSRQSAGNAGKGGPAAERRGWQRPPTLCHGSPRNAVPSAGNSGEAASLVARGVAGGVGGRGAPGHRVHEDERRAGEWGVSEEGNIAYETGRMTRRGRRPRGTPNEGSRRRRLAEALIGISIGEESVLISRVAAPRYVLCRRLQGGAGALLPPHNQPSKHVGQKTSNQYEKSESGRRPLALDPVLAPPPARPRLLALPPAELLHRPLPPECARGPMRPKVGLAGCWTWKLNSAEAAAAAAAAAAASCCLASASAASEAAAIHRSRSGADTALARGDPLPCRPPPRLGLCMPPPMPLP